MYPPSVAHGLENQNRFRQDEAQNQKMLKRLERIHWSTPDSAAKLLVGKSA
jgi:hypothetical protein